MQRKASEGMDGMNPSDFRKSGTFPQRHRISEQFPVVLTPSEQVSEEVSQLPTAILPASYTCSSGLDMHIQSDTLQTSGSGPDHDQHVIGGEDPFMLRAGTQ